MPTPELTTNETPRGVLATDMDGTLIPLTGCIENESDLQRLSKIIKEQGFHLVFVTGRRLSSVESAIQEFKLPSPDWVICDVGTSLFRTSSPGVFEPIREYASCLSGILKADSIQPLADRLSHIAGLRMQENEKQGRFKLSYYADAESLSGICANIRDVLLTSDIAHELISSVDPFNGDGLIDILPKGVSKVFALNWWASFLRISPESIIFAGDSGNDLAVMIDGYKTIVVGNADRSLSEQVKLHHENHGWVDRLFIAEANATSAVLHGLEFFGGW